MVPVGGITVTVAARVEGAGLELAGVTDGAKATVGLGVTVACSAVVGTVVGLLDGLTVGVFTGVGLFSPGVAVGITVEVGSGVIESSGVTVGVTTGPLVEAGVAVSAASVGVAVAGSRVGVAVVCSRVGESTGVLPGVLVRVASGVVVIVTGAVVGSGVTLTPEVVVGSPLLEVVVGGWVVSLVPVGVAASVVGLVVALGVGKGTLVGVAVVT